MNFDLSDVQAAVRDTARTFAQGKVAPQAARLSKEERFPVALLRECAALGLLGVNLPERYGGADAGVVAYSLMMTELSAADCSLSVAVSVTNMVGELIDAFGTEAQKKKYLPRLLSGEAVCGAFALSETQSASDAAAMRTVAERRQDRYVLSGSKQWISNGSYAGVLIVWARTDREARGAKGISTFIVEGGQPGMTAGPPEDKMGLRSSNTVPLHFEGCEIPAENLLGREGEGFKLAMMALDGGRIGIGSQACGVSRAALEASVRYARERRAFGHPIAELEAIRFFVADMATQLEAAELLTLRAAWLKEERRPFTREASMAKVFASEMAQRVCDKAVQIHGGYGYIDEFPVERYFRDARVQTLYEGTSEIQRLVIARDLLRSA
jgi:alkylation response protein AidB-like acyl-CoA dehydrogenase